MGFSLHFSGFLSDLFNGLLADLLISLKLFSFVQKLKRFFCEEK